MIYPLQRYLITLFLIFTYISLFSQEGNSILCSDGIDNDGDGLIDCEDSECLFLSNQGCVLCSEGISFADLVIDYVSGCPQVDPLPSGALGLSDYSGATIDAPDFVFLGQGGYIKLAFTNNLIVNSGDGNPDIYVFEVGPVVESMSIALRPADAATETMVQNSGFLDSDLDGFYDIGDIAGAVSSFDIDNFIVGADASQLRFDAIKITDIIDAECGVGLSPGADIDAVCALFYEVIDCFGIIDGTAVFDSCDVCIEPDDPLFNQSCIDCFGEINGIGIIDSCGLCIEANSPFFNQSCLDCFGVVNGIAILDSCGVCIEPNDPLFNDSCIDCFGEINGTAVLDSCGVCLALNDPNINQSCLDCFGVINGTAIIDSCGICIDFDDPLFNQSCFDCFGIMDGTAIIDSCGICIEPNDPSINQSCLDCFGVINGNSIIDSCGVCIEPSNPLFNQSCSDCFGIINGIAILDSCGVCIVPGDPNWNQSCLDCFGELNGGAIIDTCGVCIEPDDPLFNQSCLDCFGVVNGTALVDSCGVCLEPDDLFFNLACIEDCPIYIPNVFSPNGDFINDEFELFECKEGGNFINEFLIFDRWGNLVFKKKNFSLNNYFEWWDGSAGGDFLEDGVYGYYLDVTDNKLENKQYIGDVLLIK